MSQNDSPLVASLRADITRKYEEAIKALDTIAGYISAAPLPIQQAPAAAKKAVATNSRSNVELVLDSLSNSEFKTVDEIHNETGLPEKTVRGALYSKFVLKNRIVSKKIGKRMAFKLKPPDSDKGTATVTSLVRKTLEGNPAGLTPAEIAAKIAVELDKIGGTKGAITAALYNMKQGGKVAHDASSGTYRIALAS